MPILLLLLALLLLFFSIAFYLYRVAFFPKRYTYDETIHLEIDAGKINSFDSFNNWPHEDLTIQSPFGYTLRARYFPLEGSTKTVIFSHGITITLFGSAKYMAMFRRRGYNLFVYDNRRHGMSGGSFCSFGFFEKHDLKTMVDWVLEKTGPGSLVGTHGESLGAAITLQHAALDPRIAFAIADCPFSDLHELFKLRLKQDYHLPAFPLLDICRIYAKLLLGFDLLQSSPIRYLSSVKTPVLLIHGQEDTYILPQMSKDLYAAKTQGPRRLYLVPGAAHACAYSTSPDEYERQVNLFLDEQRIA